MKPIPQLAGGISLLSRALALAVLALAAPAHSQTPDTFSPGTDASVEALAVQPDGRILVGGGFTKVGGQPRNHLARLSSEGGLDPTFNPAVNGTVFCLAVQPDGKILIGGTFTTVGGLTRSNLARLNPDGSLDTAFTTSAAGGNPVAVSCLAVQSDGKVLVGGSFTTLGDQARANIGRLNPDGTVDTTFNPGTAGSVYALALQPDGEILVGGFYYTLGGQAQYCLGRLSPAGVLDSSFNPSAGGQVNCLAVQPDGRILVGGWFSTLGGVASGGLGRVNTNGTLDTTFTPAITGGSYTSVYSLALQANGRIVVGGAFTSLGGLTNGNLGRLNADGTGDGTFNASPNNILYAVALQADGKLLLGGWFDSVNGQTNYCLARLSNPEPASQALSISGATATWSRGGSSPEVWRTTFDVSTNGADWTNLGAGTRVAGGWELAGLSLPGTATLRARGFVSGGDGNGSTWFVDTMSGPPAISLQPSGRTNNAGTVATFSVTAGGSPSPGYQWHRGGANLVEGGNVFGASAPILTLSNVWGADAGDYSVVISSSSGSVTSTVAPLVVMDPVLSLQPVDQALALGQRAAFRVTAVGTRPVCYQWRKDGNAVPGATVASLTVSNAQKTDGGWYEVAVTNAFGWVSSRRAALSVNAVTPDSYGAGVDMYAGSLAVQRDGKVLVAGVLHLANGSNQDGVWRLGLDGTLDGTFDPPALSSGWALAVQTDGKIITAGTLYSNGQSTNAIWRLNPDGSLDASYIVAVDGTAYALVIQPDGKLLVGGWFGTLAGQPCGGLGRLGADGALDTAFVPAAGGSVNCVVAQSDGKTLVAGALSVAGGPRRSCICRLNGDGSLDPLFHVAESVPSIYAVAVQADGKILVGGDLTALTGVTRYRIARLNEDGTLDVDFNPGITEPVCPLVESLAVQADGKILIAGGFTQLGGQARTNIARLNADGSLDLTFNPGAGGTVFGVALQGDGKVLAVGSLSSLGGQTRKGLGRLSNTDPATEQLASDGATITWLRGGSSPELCSASFEVSTNGTDWSLLGLASRIPGGWQMSGLSLPTNITLRARGFAAGGYQNGSSWVLETVAGLPFITSQPTNWLDLAGATVTFSVDATGTLPLGYQWSKDGIRLSDGGGVSGAHSSGLTQSGVSAADAGKYSVTISNAFGTTTSREAILTVTDPFIDGQPADQTAGAGQLVWLGATAGGTPSVSYQWYKDGAALENQGNVSGAQTAILALSNVLHGDTGGYSLVVSNTYGSVTSRVAVVTVQDPFISTTPLSLTAFAGQAVTLQVTAKGTAPLAYQWRRSGTNLPAATLSALAFPQVKPSDRGYYDAVVSNLFGCVTSAVALLTVNPVTQDPITAGAGADNGVSAFVIQPDGKIVVGGSFTSLAGQSHPYLARINADGSLDASFTPAADYPVYCLALQEDGKIVVGGMFGTLCGQPRTHLGRLNPDGSLDTAFTAAASGSGPYAYYVYSLAMQADGKILVGGWFATLAGETRNGIGRLNSNGTLDLSFNPACDGGASCLAVQPDGKIVVGGSFTLLGGQPHSCIGRLNADGTVDTNFTAQATGASYFQVSVSCLAVQANGQILVGGNFWGLCGETHYALGRLNPDGTLDAAFDPEALDDVGVSGLALQADGKILAGGSFNMLAGQTCHYVGRLDSNGMLDTTFSSTLSSDYWLSPLALQADGKVLVGGYFSSVTGQTRYIGRLNNTDPAIQQLAFDGSSASWLRDGTTPELWRASFEASTNGSDWYSLGTGARIPGGWQLGELSLPTNATLRARGFVSGSGSIVESRLAVDPKTQPRLWLNNSSHGGFQGFGFDLSGLIGQVVVVQASTNLVDWTALATNTLGAGRSSFTDSQSPSFSQRYYRLILPAQ